MAKSNVDIRHYDVILSPHITEKSTLLSEHNAVVFKVADAATQPQIKAAVEALFDVKVTGVNTLVTKGKTKRFGKTIGRRDNVRKAYVRLKPGQELNLSGEAA